MRRIVFIAASVLVSAVFLWLAIQDIPREDIINNIGQADPLWLLISMVITAFGLFFRAVRWRGLLGFKIPLIKAFHIWNITSLLNQLPLRAGEVARSLLSMREGVPIVTAATSIVVERLLDTLFVVILLTFALSRSPTAPDFAVKSVTLFGVLAVIGFVALVIFARYPAFARGLLTWFEGKLPLLGRLHLGRLLEHVIDGLQPLTHWRSASHAIVWTVISWTCSYLTFYALHRAMRVEGVDLWLSAALTVSLASFSIAIPVSLAGIGPFQAAVRIGGEAVVPPAMWETMKAPYAALGFLIHGMNVLNYAIWGTIGMIAMGVSLGEVMKSSPPAPIEAAPAEN